MAKLAVTHIVLFSLAAPFAVPSTSVQAQLIQTIVGGGFTAPTASDFAPSNFSVGLTDAVAVDSQGNVYIADITHGSVYRVTLSGSVAVVAGNGTPGNIPALQNPTGLAVDANDNLFIADQDAGLVYEIPKSGGIPQVVAGCGSINDSACSGATSGYGNGGNATSAIIQPVSVFVDGSNNIFIADIATCSIREVYASGDIVTRAGSACPQDSTNSISTASYYGAATLAVLYPPQSVAVDSSGNIFIADAGENVVREVCGVATATCPAGYLETIAGGGSQPIPTGTTSVSATTVQLGSPRGLALQGGKLYITDYDQDVVIAVTTGPAGGALTLVAGTVSSPGPRPIGPDYPFTVNGPVGLALFGNDIYIADSLDYAVRSVGTSTSGSSLLTVAGNNTVDSFVGEQSPSSIQLATPVAVSEDASANIYFDQTSLAHTSPSGFPDEITFQIEISAQGQITSRLLEAVASPPVAKLLNTSTVASAGLFLDQSDDLFFADGGLEELSPTFGLINVPINITVVGVDQDYLDLTGDSANNLYLTSFSLRVNEVNYIADYATSSFLVDPGLTLGTYPFPPSTLGDGKPAQQAIFANISGLCTDVHGNLYVTDKTTNLVRVINTGQQQITIATIPIAANSIETIAGGGGMLPQDMFSHFDYKAQQIGDGGQATMALLSPQACFVDNLGNVFIADGYNDRIRRIDANTDQITTVAGSQFGGFSGDGGPATSASLNFPNSVWGDQAGNLLISDSGNHRIREISGILPVPNASLSCQNCSLTDATGSNSTATVMLTNMGSAPLIMSTGPTLTDPQDFRISGSTCPLHVPGLATNTTCVISVVATGIKAATTNLVLHDNALLNNTVNPASGPDRANSGQWSGYLQYSDSISLAVLGAAVNFNPLSLVFTAENVKQSIQVQNKGSVPLTINTVTVPSPFFSQTNPPPDSCGVAPFTLAANSPPCMIYIVFSPTASSGQGTSGSISITDSTSNSTQSIPVLGYALVASGNTSFNISSSAPVPVTAKFSMVGIPPAADVNTLCSVTPAGLDVVCTYNSSSQTITATASIPSCVQTSKANVPAHAGGARYFPFAVAGLALLLPCRRSNRKRLLSLLGAAVLSCAIAGISACSSTNQVSGTCVASVPAGKSFMLNVTANPESAGTFPSLTLTAPDVITVGQ